jgi:hypothetical protein
MHTDYRNYIHIHMLHDREENYRNMGWQQINYLLMNVHNIKFSKRFIFLVKLHFPTTQKCKPEHKVNTASPQISHS